MADFINPATLDVALSVHDAAAPWVKVPRAEAEAALAIPAKYRKWDGKAVVEMTQGEKDAADAATERASFLAVQGASLARLFPDGKTFSHKDAEIWESAVAVLFDVVKGTAQAETLRDVLTLIAVRRATDKGVVLG